MALTLDGILSAAQDLQNRHPICKIVSDSFSDDIPFEGYDFKDTGDMHNHPCMIEHSNGGIYIAYTEGYEADSNRHTSRYLYLYYTDVEKKNWTRIFIYQKPVTLYNYWLYYPCICELANGNIGIIYAWQAHIEELTGIERIIVDQAGAIVTAATSIVSKTDWTYGGWVNYPYVIRLANGTYFLVYIKYHEYSYYLCYRTSSDFITWSAEGTITL